MGKSLWMALVCATALGGCGSMPDIPIHLGKAPRSASQPAPEQSLPAEPQSAAPGEGDGWPSWISIGKKKPASDEQAAQQKARTPAAVQPMLPSWITIGKPKLLAEAFQDHMVFQRDKSIRIWGRAIAGTDVRVQFGGQTIAATADDAGAWTAEFAPRGAGGPYTLTVEANSRSQTLNDVMVGDVYLCSGQSNIEWTVMNSMHGASDAAGAANAMIRLFAVHRSSGLKPSDTFGGGAEWSLADPEHVKGFSAICYFFGRELQPKAGVPIGLISSVWGGSPIQAWMSGDALKTLGGYDEQLALLTEYATSPGTAQTKWNGFMDAWWGAHDPLFATAPDPKLDDSGWASIVPSGSWKDWGVPALRSFDGIMWLRQTVTITAAQAAGGAQLSLGPIDQADKTFVNGTEVGGGEGWDFKRVYTIPAGVLREGKNVIAVGARGGDGMYGPANARELSFENGTSVKLDGPWRYRTSAGDADLGAMPHTPWLKELGTTTLYNGMIAPLTRAGVRAVIWYQGESNTNEAGHYDTLLKTFIADWRSKFGTDMPFLIVQLPSYGPPVVSPRPSPWADLREAQRKVALDVPGTGMATTIDLGDRANLHPVVKQEVGRRLALVAERKIYGLDVLDSGPTPAGASRNGDVVAVTFANTGDGLLALEAASPIGFQLCDAQRHCRFVNAALRDGHIEIDAAAMPEAAAVRFCWGDSPICNLVNSQGLPAIPFELALPARVQHTSTPRHGDLHAGRTAH